jgi:hypothetical protein
MTEKELEEKRRKGREYYAKNRERLKEQRRERWAAMTPAEQLNARKNQRKANRAYQDRHPGGRVEYNRVHHLKYYAKCQEKVKAKVREYYYANRAKCIAAATKRAHKRSERLKKEKHEQRG